MYILHRVCIMPTKTEEVIRPPRTAVIDHCESPMGAVDESGSSAKTRSALNL